MNFIKRISHLQKSLSEKKCDALLIDDPTNLFYLTGLDLSAGMLLVHSRGAQVLVDGRYIELCRKNSPVPVILLDTFQMEKILASPDYSFIKTLAFDSQTTTYKNYQELENLIVALNKDPSRPQAVTLMPLDHPLQVLRFVKEPEEIRILKEAADLGVKGFDHVCTLLKVGIAEEELASELEIFWKRRGGKRTAFDPIIAFGSNSSMPHYRAGKSLLQKNQIVLIDIGVTYQHYHSDMTRVIFFGEPDERLLNIHGIVEKAQKEALQLCRPGTILGDLDKSARDIITSAGFGENFTHSLGHGVGLNIHEYPTIKNAPPFGNIPLQPGMVITIEPGIYLPQVGGVRIEDTIVITENGYENLTNRPTSPLFFL